VSSGDTMDTSKIEVVFQAPSGAPKDNSMIDLFMALAWPIAIILVILLLRKPNTNCFEIWEADSQSFLSGHLQLSLRPLNRRVLRRWMTFGTLPVMHQ